MKGKILPITLLVGAMLIGGCGSKSQTSQVVEDGKYVLFTINGTSYYADDVLGFESDRLDINYLNSNQGLTSAYDEIYNAIVEASVPVTTTIKNLAELAYDDWLDETVQEVVSTYGYSKKEAILLVLENEGYKSEDEKKAALLLEQQKKTFEKNYLKNNLEPNYSSLKGDSPLERYLEAYTPMIVNHILIKLEDNGNYYKGASLTQDETEKLGTICNRLALSNNAANSFDSIALQSDDGTYAYGGCLGIMDQGTSFVSSFKYGTYAGLMALADNKEDYKKALHINDENYEALFGSNGIYPNGTVQTIEVDKIATDLLTNSTNAAKRNEIFNTYFNTPEVKFLTYSNSASDQNYPVDERSVNAKNIVTDSNGYPIMVVRSEYGVHFITVSYDSINNSAEDNAKYFAFSSSNKIITKDNNYCLNENYTGYDDLASAIQEKQEDIKDAVTNYLEGGFVGIEASETYLSYNRFLDGLKSSGIEINNALVRKAIIGKTNDSLLALNTVINEYNNSLIEGYIDSIEFDHEMRKTKK